MRLEHVVEALGRQVEIDLADVAFRHVRAGRDPLSGEGARLHGGRWNPPGSFATLYLATTRAIAIAELHRAAASQGLRPAGFLPRDLVSIRVDLRRVLDVRDDIVAASLGLPSTPGDDLTASQRVAEAARNLGFEAILAPSAAASDGEVLAVFPDRLHGASTIEVEASRALAPAELE